jgi:diguanylate cyclase (GGDEF)-like protein
VQINLQSLLEQLRITDHEIESRKALLLFTDQDVLALSRLRATIDRQVQTLVDQFYEEQLKIPDIALLIGDADTLHRLRNAQRRYVLDLFVGVYDQEYVNSRLRIGLVHKRIGVDPKLYLAGVHRLQDLLVHTIAAEVADGPTRRAALSALNKLIVFDVTLVFDTYIRSMMQEIDVAKQKVEVYAQSLEQTVCERTRQLEELSRTDPLTRLNNRRCLNEAATHALRAARRRREPLTILYFDVNDFKQINDVQGHLRGDDVLAAIGELLLSTSRSEDLCFRYGGDEFVVLLPNCTESEARDIYWPRYAASVAERLDGLTLSVGICQTGPDEYLDIGELIRGADERMYLDKHRYREHVARADQPLATPTVADNVITIQHGTG